MDNGWLLAAAVLAGLILLPALIAGGGFFIAIPLAIILLVAAVGGPRLWDLYLKKNVGAKGRDTDVRDFLGGGQTETDDIDDTNR